MSQPRKTTLGQKLSSTVSALLKRLKRISGRDELLIFAAVPILFLFAVASQTFELSWAGFGKLGRGGLFFVLFFLGFDLLDFKKGKIRWTKRQKAATAVVVAMTTIYFVEVGLGQDVTNFVYSIGRSLGASGDVSNSFLVGFVPNEHDGKGHKLSINLSKGQRTHLRYTPVFYAPLPRWLR